MQPLSFNTPGLLFPAISLLMLAYTNRFLGLSSLARQLLSKYRKDDPSLIAQVENLRFRISLIRYTQILGILSLIFCISSLGFIFIQNGIAWFLFGFALFLMGLSLLFSLFEIHLSIRALDIEIQTVLQKNHFREENKFN